MTTPKGASVTEERLAGLIADAQTEYNTAASENDFEAGSFWGPLLDALRDYRYLLSAQRQPQAAVATSSRGPDGPAVCGTCNDTRVVGNGGSMDHGEFITLPCPSCTPQPQERPQQAEKAADRQAGIDRRYVVERLRRILFEVKREPRPLVGAEMTLEDAIRLIEATPTADDRRDAERYRYWRTHQYNGLLDTGELCDANSPQAVHFDRITDAAMSSAPATGAEARGEGK